MPSVTTLLGESLLKGEATIPTAGCSGEGKVLGLYFSAHWCPPCRGFTPKLAEFYKKITKTEKGANFEIVFVSSDRDEVSFKEYFGEMPWAALPYSDRDRKAKLSKRFKVQGIPTFIIIDGATGKTITTEGRSQVDKDPEGKEFPWHPKPLGDLLKGDLKRGKEETVALEVATEGKVTALYFSAHWCPPCKTFTPKLCEAYKKIVADGKNFECIFASWDQTESQFDSYYAEMPFLAFPFEDDRIQALQEYFGVDGIPSLIILDEKKEVITTNGRGPIMTDPEGKDFPWHPKPAEELTNGTASILNDQVTVLLLGAGEASEAEALMKATAEDYVTRQKASRDTDDELPELSFLYEGPNSGELVERIRSFASLGDRSPLLVFIDVPAQRKYEVPDGAVLDEEAVKKLLQDFEADTIPWEDLGLE